MLHWVSHGVVMGLISSSAFALVHNECFCQEYLPLWRVNGKVVVCDMRKIDKVSFETKEEDNQTVESTRQEMITCSKNVSQLISQYVLMVGLSSRLCKDAHHKSKEAGIVQLNMK